MCHILEQTSDTCHQFKIAFIQLNPILFNIFHPPLTSQYELSNFEKHKHIYTVHLPTLKWKKIWQLKLTSISGSTQQANTTNAHHVSVYWTIHKVSYLGVCVRSEMLKGAQTEHWDS